MALVVDSLTWATNKVAFGLYIGESDPELSLYQLPYEATLDAADEYLNNPFVDDDGVDFMPNAIKLGVYELARRAREMSGNNGATMEKTGDLQKQYSIALLVDDIDIYARYWHQWRLEPGN